MEEHPKTTEVVFPSTAYEVSVDRTSLAVWDLDRDGMGYAVQLTGSIDDRWARCFYILRIESRSYSRFHLDRQKQIVWFACRANDRPAKIQPVLDTLGRLVESVNQSAESETWNQ